MHSTSGVLSNKKNKINNKKNYFLNSSLLHTPAFETTKDNNNNNNTKNHLLYNTVDYARQLTILGITFSTIQSTTHTN